MMDQKEALTDYVTKVAVKLPDFWTEDPNLWFLHAEAAFRNAQITQSKTKFDHIIQPDHGFCRSSWPPLLRI